MAVLALDNENYGGAVAFAPQANQLLEMLRAAFAHRVGEGCHAIHGKCYILDLYKTKSVAAFETKVQSCSRASNHFSTNSVVADQLQDDACFNSFGD